MISTVDTKPGLDGYLEDFAARTSRHLRQEPAWLVLQREAAFGRFAETGFPSTRNEAWRFTNVAKLAGTRFAAVDGQPTEPSLGESDLARWRFEPWVGPVAVFLDGHYRPELSSIPEDLQGVRILSLAEAAGSHAAEIEPVVARRDREPQDAFADLNTAFFEDGALVIVEQGADLAEPIHLLFITTAETEPTAGYPRTIVVAHPNSRASLVESFVSFGSAAILTSSVTDILAGEGAAVRYCTVQHEAASAFHVGALRMHLARDSRVTAHTVSLGGSLVRNNLEAVLAGQGAECAMHGLYLATGDQHVDNHLRVEHAQPHCSSRENYRGILSDRARGVFTGRIRVHPGAQKTDAKQTNMNLLLSEAAQVNTRPQLEIFADDVKCTHGATVGQINKDALFYLQTRGVSRTAARDLLICAFAGESLESLEVEPVRARLDSEVLRRLAPEGSSER